MIAVDTSSFIAYLQGENAKDVLWVEEALSSHALVLPPVVASEILSDASLPLKLIANLSQSYSLKRFLLTEKQLKQALRLA